MDEPRIDLDGIMRSLEANGFDEVDVEFVPDKPRDLALADAMFRAASAANRDVPETAGAGPEVSVDGVSVRVKDYWDFDSLAAWLAALAGALAADGYEGLVRATPVVALPQWFAGLSDPLLTAYVAFDGDIIDRHSFGNLAAAPETPGAARWCERCVEWAAAAGDHGYLANVFHQPARAGDLGSLLYLGLRMMPSASAVFAPERPGPASRVHLQHDGSAVLEAFGPWPPLARAREALLACSEQARVGFVAVTRQWQYVWRHGAHALPPLPPVALAGNSALWGEHVPDAYGMMLLTGRHLSRVADLSRWRVTPLEAGRYLVEASDADEWFGLGGPDEAVLARARGDLGDAIAAAPARSSSGPGREQARSSR